MSIDCCNRCSKHIDTDFAPEVYREEYGHECLCESCYEGRTNDALEDAAVLADSEFNEPPTEYGENGSARESGWQDSADHIRVAIRSLKSSSGG